MPAVSYHFHFPDGRAETIEAGPQAVADDPLLPDWTRLEHSQCPNCPLSSATTPRCPMALQFVDVIARMGPLCSYDEVAVRVDTPARSVTTNTTVQRAIGSLLGLLAAESACPHTAFLKPMAHFHLPFATEEETIYRAASMHLLAQYFIGRQGGAPDWQLAGLKASYKELQSVNGAMAKRLRAISSGDGTVNALILLDLLAKALHYSIDDALEEIQSLFVRQA
jgi:hypothetical protein